MMRRSPLLRSPSLRDASIPESCHLLEQSRQRQAFDAPVVTATPWPITTRIPESSGYFPKSRVTKIVTIKHGAANLGA